MRERVPDDSCCPPELTEPDLRPADGPGVDEELALLAKALGHPVRVRVLRMLLRRESCICGEIVSDLNLPQSTVSQHLKCLKDAGLLRGQVDGSRVCYCADLRSVRRLRSLIGSL